MKVGGDFEVVDPGNDPRYREYWTEYHRLAARRGVTPAIARAELRRERGRKSRSYGVVPVSPMVIVGSSASSLRIWKSAVCVPVTVEA